jgi:hypothetical protein
MAPFVGLQRHLEMNDIETFDLHRSRIPTALFKSIVCDIDVMQVQYGPPFEHETEEVRSRFLSPVSVSHFSDHQRTQTSTLRSLTALLLYLALLLGTGLNLPSRVVSPPKAGWSITSRQLIVPSQFFL